jgi:hypothetical protein
VDDTTELLPLFLSEARMRVQRLRGLVPGLGTSPA